ncbi:hypothetical protein [Austwickia chelonae]|uniref:hypothetical protein n=1 Tax=Austwickia chelonae TaxID=100225 RepID=UPI0013C3479D|nr:hypothetical protein [Austwickia chelonae]
MANSLKLLFKNVIQGHDPHVALCCGAVALPFAVFTYIACQICEIRISELFKSPGHSALSVCLLVLSWASPEWIAGRVGLFDVVFLSVEILVVASLAFLAWKKVVGDMISRGVGGQVDR